MTKKDLITIHDLLDRGVLQAWLNGAVYERGNREKGELNYDPIGRESKIG